MLLENKQWGRECRGLLMCAMQRRWPQHRVVPSVQPHGILTSYCSLNFRNFLDINQFGCRVCRSRLQPSAHLRSHRSHCNTTLQTTLRESMKKLRGLA